MMPQGFSARAIRESETDAKIALIATVDPSGLPHVTLITTLQAMGPRQLTWGQFCEGLSKENARRNPRTGFLIMTQKRELWRGKAEWTHEAKEGPEYELYNRKPMFRYNSYLGIHTVHYMDLVAVGQEEKLRVGPIIAGSALAAVGRLLAGRSSVQEPALKPWAENLLGNVGTIKFLSYIGKDGFPVIIPALPCLASAGSRRIFFARNSLRGELKALTPGQAVALFAINQQAESILIRGAFSGYRPWFGRHLGVIEIDWVYNSMPPKHGQIYPPEPLHPVTHF